MNPETYVPFPVGTVRGPYHTSYPRQKPQTQFLVQGKNGWVPFIRIGADAEKEARAAAEAYANEILNQ